MRIKDGVINIIVVIIMVLSTVLVFVPEKVGGTISTTCYVGGSGPGNYSSIQQAITHASPGDTIVVYPGLYQENLLIDKSLTLRGKEKETTFITPLIKDHGVSILSDSVTLDGFTIRGENHTNYAGIKIDSRNHTRITNCTILYNSYGIWLYSSRQNEITSCNISSNYEGIWVHYFSQYNVIQRCQFFFNTHSGVYLCCAAAHNTVSRNTLTLNGVGVDAGFSWNEIYLNNFFANTDNVQCPVHENTWDDGSVGNYWSDFDEPGEGAYDADGDGVVDSPYVIPGEKENMDRYPLIMPHNLTLNQPPTCALSVSSTSGTTPFTVIFTLMANDPDGSIASWTLDIDNDQVIEYEDSENPPVTQQHTYTTPGTYTANFTVADSHGATASDTVTVTVNQAPPQNQAPICFLTGNPTSGLAPLMVTFTMSASDPDGSITTWALDIDNDGTPDYTGTSNPPATQEHTYTALGNYTARFTVTDNQSASASDTAIIVVGQTPLDNQPPLANFTCSFDGLLVAFSDASTDSDGVVTLWYWDFGDYTYSTASNPLHEYGEKGEYVVNLTVTDDDNETHSVTRLIRVEKEDDNGGISVF